MQCLMFSKNRLGRFRDSEAFRYVFERVLQSCVSEGLVGGEGLHKIQAN